MSAEILDVVSGLVTTELATLAAQAAPWAGWERVGVVTLLVFAVSMLALGKFVTPRWVLDASERRNELLEKESETLNAELAGMRGQNGALREEIAGLKAEVRHLTEQVGLLRREVGS